LKFCHITLLLSLFFSSSYRVIYKINEHENIKNFVYYNKCKSLKTFSFLERSTLQNFTYSLFAPNKL